jgi:hypothetical protein
MRRRLAQPGCGKFFLRLLFEFHGLSPNDRSPITATAPLPNAWRKGPGAPKGNKNALKYGPYTAEAIARGREFSALVRVMKVLATASG